MIHPDTRIEDAGPMMGYGVIASARIPRGTITWVKDPLDRSFKPAQVSEMADVLRAAVACYAFLEPNGDAVLCWDLARFMNHSCRPNTTSCGEDFDIALRDIEPGEAITTDYGNFGIFNPLVCACGEPTCRRVVRSADPDQYGALWAAEASAALAIASSVPQPLLDLALRNPADARLLTTLKEAKDIP